MSQSEETPEKIEGSIRFYGDEISYEAQCNAIAITRTSGLLFASIVTEQIKIKGIRSILNTDRKVKVSFSGMSLDVPLEPGKTRPYWHRPITSGHLEKHAESYHFETHRLQYGMAHAVLWSKSDSLILSMDDASIWRKLKSDEFTTPLMPHWTRYLVQRLKDASVLSHAHCQGCNVGTIIATTKDLDAIVSDGLAKREISIIPPKGLPWKP